MACLKFITQNEYQALSAATALSLIEVIAPANQRVKILGWGIGFNATNTTILATPADTLTKAPAEVELLIGSSSSGTFTHTLSTTMSAEGSITIIGDIDGTVQSSCKTTSTVEPTFGGCVDVTTVNPTGSHTAYFDEPVILNGGEYICVVATSPSGVSARAKLICEE